MLSKYQKFHSVRICLVESFDEYFLIYVECIWKATPNRQIPKEKTKCQKKFCKTNTFHISGYATRFVRTVFFHPQYQQNNTTTMMRALMLPLCVVAVQAYDFEDLTKCAQKALEAAGFDENTGDFNCGDSPLAANCQRKAGQLIATGLSCVQEYTAMGDIAFFNLPALSSPDKTRDAFDCLLNEMLDCDVGVRCDGTFECMDQFTCGATAVNTCLKADIFPLADMKTSEQMLGYDFEPFNDCMDSKNCNGDSSNQARICQVSNFFDCGISSGLLKDYTKGQIKMFLNVPNTQCMNDKIGACITSKDCQLDSSNTPDQCIMQATCIGDVVNECAGYDLIPTRFFPSSVKQTVDCTQSYIGLCPGDDGMIDKECAVQKALMCAVFQGEHIEALKSDLSSCQDNVVKCVNSDPNACAGDFDEACFDMINCAAHGGMKCVNDAIQVALPNAGLAPKGSSGLPLYAWILIGTGIAMVLIFIAVAVWMMTKKSSVKMMQDDYVQQKNYAVNDVENTHMTPAC